MLKGSKIYHISMYLKCHNQLQLGKYTIIKTLGQGGFGITYLAEQSNLGRKVAIKEFFLKEHCNRDSETSHVTIPSGGSREMINRFKEKFLKEARTIAGLSHPNIVKIYDVFEENGTAYFVMDYIDNGDLKTLTKDSPIPENIAAKYISQISDALEYLHRKNILHLDIKPSNILINRNQEAILIDFGISKKYDGGGDETSSTPVGISKGYAPLEQYNEGVKKFAPSSDIYSLGATIYKLVTGQVPPEAALINEDGLPSSFPNVSKEAWRCITKFMQPKRKDRPQTIQDAKKYIQKWVDSQNSKSIDWNDGIKKIIFNGKETANRTIDSLQQKISTASGNGAERVNIGGNTWIARGWHNYKGKVKEVESLRNSKTNRILRNQLWGVILITLFTFFIFFNIELNTLTTLALFPLYALLGAFFLQLNKKAGLWMLGTGIYALLSFMMAYFVFGPQPEDEWKPSVRSYLGHEGSICVMVLIVLVSLGFVYLYFWSVKNTMEDSEHGICYWDKFDNGTKLLNFKLHRTIFYILPILSVAVLEGDFQWRHHKYLEQEEYKIAHKYDNAKIGDYFYADGTTSSEILSFKDKPIGIIFSLSPSESEKAAGFTHGEIISLNDAVSNCVAWGIDDFDVVGYTNHAITNKDDVKKAKEDTDGYKHIVDDFDTIAVRAAVEARNYQRGVNDCISSWYLPNASQWVKIIENIGGTKVSDDIFMKFDKEIVAKGLEKANIKASRWYWINTEFDNNNAWSVCINQGFIGAMTQKNIERGYVRPVAAF